MHILIPSKKGLSNQNISYKESQLTIPDNLFLDVLLVEVRGEV